MTSRFLLAALACSALAVNGCGGRSIVGEPEDGGADAGFDAGEDAGSAPDSGVDAGTDAGADAGTDAGTDAGIDGGTDAGSVDSDAGPICGNHVVEGNEQCDDGNDISGDGCENDCTFTCTSSDQCDDGVICNGLEVCGADHKCAPGAPAQDGTACDNGDYCVQGLCSPIVCGDGVTGGSEECDDGNPVGGDGCNNDCTFSCVSTDSARSCAPADPCQGQGTCNDTTHVCAAGTPLEDGTSCGGNNYCHSGTCTTPVCGNGVTEPGEACDNGTNNGPNHGCELNCTVSCTNSATDCAGAAPVCEKWACSSAHTCAAVADSAAENHPCGASGSNFICKSGACIDTNAVCGNGTVEQGEQCDFGQGNAPGIGCETNCQFSCQTSPNTCPTDPCRAQATCVAVVVNGGEGGQKCQPGAPVTDGTSCGSSLVCIAGNCQASLCGDGFVDPSRGETCEPPSTATCDANCHLNPACGDGVRESGEQCDDSGNGALDGCSASCRFEQAQHVSWLNLMFDTDAICPDNALGSAIVESSAQALLAGTIQSTIRSGTTSVLLAFVGLNDLTGTAESPVTVGLLAGTPQAPAGAPTYDGTSALDWWYTPDPSSIDATRAPLNTFPASFAGRMFSAGPGDLTLALNFGGGAAPLRFTDVRLRAPVGGASTPTQASGALPPGHVAAEHLDPALVSFETLGQPDAAGGGHLCGNIGANALAAVPLPSTITQACPDYGATNSILDLMVGGCSFLGFIPIVAPTQPDKVDPAATPAGAGAPYTLSASSGKTVDTCHDHTGAQVDFETCLAAAEYSSFFEFATERAIIRP